MLLSIVFREVDEKATAENREVQNENQSSTQFSLICMKMAAHTHTLETNLNTTPTILELVVKVSTRVDHLTPEK